MNTRGAQSAETADESSNQPDYGSVELPQKPEHEYTYVERRAELLQLVQRVGHPSRINQTSMAQRYGVSQQQISKDLDRLAEYSQEHLGDRRELVVDSVAQRSVEGLLEDGEYRQAWSTALEWEEWVTEKTDLAELREKIELLEQEASR